MPLARTYVPFGELQPDKAQYRDGGTLYLAKNAYPRTRQGDGSVTYGPWPAPLVFSDALTARCQGAFAGRSSAGNVTIFACDATKLYKLSSAAAWGDVTGTALNISASEHGEFCQFGDSVIFVEFQTNPQVWTLDSSSGFTDLGGTPPKARHCAVIEPGFVMLGNLASYPNGVQWSAYNDATSGSAWPTPGSSAAQAVQSDRTILPIGGWVNRIVGPVGGSKGAVIMDSAIYRVDYVQGLGLAFAAVVQGRGSIAPFSCVNVAISNSQTVTFLWCEDGAYAYDGTTAQPIGSQRVDQYVLNTLSAGRSQMHRIYGWQDPSRKIVGWQIPTAATGNSAATVLFNWDTKSWSILQPSAQESKPAEFGCQMLSLGYTLDGLDTLGYTLDTLPFSLDDRVWTGGAPQLAYFDSDHKLNYYSGSSLAAQFKTGQLSGSPGRRVFCAGIRPIGSALDGTNSVPRIKLYTADSANDTGTATTATTVGVDGVCPQRSSARYLYAQMDIDAGGTWQQAQGLEVVMREEGLR